MAVPDYQTLMLPVLQRAASGEQRVIDLIESLADEFNLTEAERAQLLPSGKQSVLHNRAHWAKFHLHKAGLVEIPTRGRFVATEAGRALLREKPSRIDFALLEKVSPPFREFIQRLRKRM